MERMAEASLTKTIGSCIINRGNELGGGGFGTVFAASMPVAAKEVPLSRVKSIKNEEHAFQKNLLHRNIIKIFDIQRDSSFLWVIMEKADCNLKMYLSKANPCTYYRLQYMRDIGDAVSYLHANKVSHRDIKPANILIIGQDREPVTVKVADFGLVKDLEEGSRMSSSVGTYEWKAPEQYKDGRKSYTNAIDIFACGLVDLFIIASQYDRQNWKNYGMKLCHDREYNIKCMMNEFRDIDWNTYPAGLKCLLEKMVSVNPNDRPEGLEIVVQFDNILKSAKADHSQQVQQQSGSQASAILGNPEVSVKENNSDQTGVSLSTEYHDGQTPGPGGLLTEVDSSMGYVNPNPPQEPEPENQQAKFIPSPPPPRDEPTPDYIDIKPESPSGVDDPKSNRQGQAVGAVGDYEPPGPSNEPKCEYLNSYTPLDSLYANLDPTGHTSFKIVGGHCILEGDKEKTQQVNPGNLCWNLNKDKPREWETFAEIPKDSDVQLVWQAMATVPGGFVVLGGAHQAKQKSSNRQKSKLCFRYSYSTSSWTPLRDLEEPRSAACAIFYGTSVYIMGGFGSDGKALKLCESLDIEEKDGHWEKHGKLPEYIALPICAVCDERIWVISNTYTWERRSFYQKLTAIPMYCFNPSEKKWIQKDKVKSLPYTIKQTDGAVAVADSCHVYLACPSNADFPITFARYSTKSNEWQILKAPLTSRKYPAMMCTSGYIFVIGGESKPQEQCKTSEKYSISEGEWSEAEIPPLPADRTLALATE